MEFSTKENEFERWKQELISSFSAWVQELKPETHIELEEAHEDPDVFTFYSVLKSIQTETRKSNRKIADVLSSIDEKLHLLEFPLADKKNQDNSLVILQLMGITDRVIRIQKHLQCPPKPRRFIDIRWTKYQSGLVDGIDLLLSNIDKIFIKTGIERIKTVGELFDPLSMFAVTVEKTDKYPENSVVEEFCAGYRYDGKVVRLAEVSVAKL